MRYRYDVTHGVKVTKTNFKKYLIGGTAALLGAGAIAIPALAAGGPTSGPVPGPGCFGNWRAGSVQDINGQAPGTDNAGVLYFSQRAGDNSTINASNRATCDL